MGLTQFLGENVSLLQTGQANIFCDGAFSWILV